MRATVAVVLLAAPAVAADKWLLLRTPNFEMYAQIGERPAREMLLNFEKVRGFFEKAFGGMTPPMPVRIVAFSSDKEFKPYKPNEGAAAFYNPGAGRDTIAMGPLTQYVQRVAVHEYVHLLIQHSNVEVPLWLNEGLAELYSTMRPYGDQVIVGVGIGAHYQQLRQMQWIPLAEIVAAGQDSELYNERHRANMFYAESWALVHMLSLGKDYRQRFGQLLALLEDGQDAASAFEAVYFKPLAVVQRDLEAYVLVGWMPHQVLLDVKLAKAEGTPVTASPDLLDLNLALATLLEERNPEEARPRYEALAKERPDRPEPEEALAFLDLKKNPRAAVEHFAHAMELGSRNPEVYWSYANALEDGEQAAVRAVAALRKAIELDPSHVDAKLALAGRLAHAGRNQEALAVLGGIDKLNSTQTPRLFETLALVKLRLGDFKDARAAAERLLKYARTPEQEARAEELLAEIARHEGTH